MTVERSPLNDEIGNQNPMPKFAIKVENLSKRYSIGARENNKTFREAFVDLAATPLRRIKSFGRSSHREEDSIWALKDVSFEVQGGEIVGIIGQNGAGKTTLLKVLSRITEPTEGRAVLNGRVASLLEVGTGFHSELTGRENIYLSGALLGMSKQEIDRKFDEIVDFSGVEKFIDTPVKRYSSGMRVRLGFAVAAHLEPEILLIDEVLAVGDAAFQKKCLGKMGDVAKEGRTVLFVSHNMSAVERLCRSAMLLDLGHKIYSGSVKDVIYFYLHRFVSEGCSGKIAPGMHKSGTGELVIDKVLLINRSGEPLSQVRMNEPFTVKIVFSVKQPVRQVRIGLGFNTMEGRRIATVHHTDTGLEAFDGDMGVYEIPFSLLNPLLPGTYIISAGAHRALGGHTTDLVPEALRFDVVELSVNGNGPVHQTYNPGLIHFNGKWKPARQVK